jgi:hypothetical protein
MGSRRTKTEVRRNFSQLLDPVVLETPAPIGRRLGHLPGLLDELPSLGDGAADFAADLQRAREELVESRVRDPWVG